VYDTGEEVEVLGKGICERRERPGRRVWGNQKNFFDLRKMLGEGVLVPWLCANLKKLEKHSMRGTRRWRAKKTRNKDERCDPDQGEGVVDVLNWFISGEGEENTAEALVFGRVRFGGGLATG